MRKQKWRKWLSLKYFRAAHGLVMFSLAWCRCLDAITDSTIRNRRLLTMMKTRGSVVVLAGAG